MPRWSHDSARRAICLLQKSWTPTMASAIPGTPMQTPALKFCILAALLPASLSFQSFAQAPAPGAAPAAAYADEPLVIERSETVVEVAADGTGWKQRTLVARLQADAGGERAEPLVMERSETVVEVAADGTGWKQRTLVARLQADAGVKRYSVLTIPYAGNSQHVEIAYARVTQI